MEAVRRSLIEVQSVRPEKFSSEYAHNRFWAAPWPHLRPTHLRKTAFNSPRLSQILEERSFRGKVHTEKEFVPTRIGMKTIERRICLDENKPVPAFIKCLK